MSLLGPIVTNTFVNNLDDGIESAVNKFERDTRLGGKIHMPERRVIMHRSLDGLED